MDPLFRTTEEVENMTVDQADEVLRRAAAMLVDQLTPCDYPPTQINDKIIPHPKEPHGFHSDDGSDDIQAAVDNFSGLWELYMIGMGGTEEWRSGVANFLLTSPMGGVDGEFRFQLFGPEVEWDGKEVGN